MRLGDSAEPNSSPFEVSTDQLALIEAGEDRNGTPFDYLIVGSGAGGGPLAARLALAGKKVLVIEAGPDPVGTRSTAYPDAETGEVTRVPGYHGAASEDAEMSWMFSVRHYADTERQRKDEKYNQKCDPTTGGPIHRKFLDPHPESGGKQGIFYPRSSGIGGGHGEPRDDHHRAK